MSDDEKQATGHQATMEERARLLVDALPHAAAIGMTVVEIGPARARLTVPYAEKLVGDPKSGVIAGGVVTTLLDNASGLAAMLALDVPQSIATLDLRIDYNRPATPGKAVLADALCHKVTRTIAFVRAVAFDESPDEPVATSVGAFMLSANEGAMVRK